MKKIFLVLVLSLGICGGVVEQANADTSAPEIAIENGLLPGSETIESMSNEERKEHLQSEILGRITQTLTSIISGLAVLMIVIAGYYYLTARGNEEKIKKAHKTIIMAVAAIFIMLFAYSIVSIITHLTSLL